MLSKAQNKYIRSLTQQKYRKEHNVFIAEGDKIAKEWLNSQARIHMVVATATWSNEQEQIIRQHPEATVHIVDESVLASVSALQTPNQVLLVVSMPSGASAVDTSEGWAIALDTIQDPGNMGTIIRIADWYGIRQIICSPECVDVYNPKVVQAAMGGHLRIRFHTAELHEYISSVNIPVLAATLNGTDIHQLQPVNKAVLMIGNESKGLHPDLIKMATQQVFIPRIGGAESLNAAVATGIICSHLIR